jgi:tetratricopeptide (TPR) repeat protein
LKSDWTNPYLPLKGRFERDMKAERFAEAAALLRRISACNPNAEVHAWVLWFLSKCTIQLGEVEETIRALKKTVELIPDVARFNNSLGLLYRTLGRMDEAEAEFKKALEKEPGYIYSIENLGGMSQIIGQGREARKWFENGLAEAQEQYKWAGDIEMKSERGFDVFKFSYFLHEIETVEGEEKK